MTPDQQDKIEKEAVRRYPNPDADNYDSYISWVEDHNEANINQGNFAQGSTFAIHELGLFTEEQMTGFAEWVAKNYNITNFHPDMWYRGNKTYTIEDLLKKFKGQ